MTVHADEEGQAAAGRPSAAPDPSPTDVPEAPPGADRDAGPTPPPRARRWLLEALLITLLAFGVTVLMYQHVLDGLSTAVPVDPTWDPLYFGWQLAWVGHAVVTDPSNLWTTNAFLREPGNLAFTDTVLGYLPISLLVGTDGMAEALRGLNLALIVATVTAFTGAYALARVLGARVSGALVAGAGFAFAPWRVQQIDHINVLSTGGMALTLALLALGHGWSLRDGWRPERIRPGWIWAAWAVACWQITFGFAIGVVFGYVLAAVMLAWLLGWLLVRRARPRLPVRLLLAHAGGGAAFLAVTVALAVPYVRALEAHPEAERTEAYLGLFSPRWLGFFTAPEYSTWYSPYQGSWRSQLGWVNETLLLPGYVLMALAVLGLALSSWTLRRRLVLGALTLVVGVLATGVAGPFDGEYTFLPLWRHLPGWDSMRTPGRLVIWVSLGLCLLAAGAVSRLADLASRARASAPARRGAVGAAAAAVLLAVPAAVVTAEGHGSTPMRPISPAPWDMRALPGPILVIPSQPLVDYQIMLWSTEGWPVMGNGSSGFDPTWIAEFRETQKGFPDPYSVHDIQARGVRTVVVIKGWLDPQPVPPTQQELDALGITRISDGEVSIYRIP